MKMEIYFNDYGNAFTDGRKISTTLTNMAEGEASRWAKPFLRRHLANEPHEFLQSWVHFRQAFLTTFSDPIKKERAIQDINKLVQKGLAQLYTAQFRTLAEELEWDEHALIDKYKSGLKLEVQNELLRSGIAMDTTRFNLEEWINLSVRADDILYASRSNKESNRNQRPKRPEQGWAAYTPPSDSTTRRDWVSEDIIKKRKEDNRCIKCGKPNHRVKECRSKAWLPDPVKGKAAEVQEPRNKETESTSSEN